ncbi:ATP-binding protein [Bifidobacterium lemurum]|nr:ATP-binding protein [Bifidobacterium lemurum]
MDFKRNVYDELLAWRNSPHRKPLLLRGARQVGKTHMLRTLGAQEYQSLSYVTLFNQDAKEAMEQVKSPSMLLDNMEAYTGVRAEPGNTLLVIDEVQEVPALYEQIKTFNETYPDMHLALAGSYLGLAMHSGVSFPVGNVDIVTMTPMTYAEFLRAVGDGILADALEAQNIETLTALTSRLEQRFRQYCVIGGMPAVVEGFIESGYAQARRIQNVLLSNYDMDFSKHPSKGVDVERIRLVFSQAIPSHLAQENNHKFMFSHIGKGARASQYESAVQTIVDSGLALRVHKVKVPRKPLRLYEDQSSFKLYMHDVGLLGAALAVSPADIVTNDRGLVEYKGVMAEQFVCQELVAAGFAPSYWNNDSSTAEVDFVFSSSRGVTPLEVKAGEGRTKRSLQGLCAEYGLHGWRASMRGYKEQDWLTNIPLWMVGTMFRPSGEEDFAPDAGADLGAIEEPERTEAIGE